MAHQLSLTALPGLPLIQAGDELATLIRDGLHNARIELRRGDVLVVSSKVISKAEGRLVDLAHIEPSSEAMQLAEESGKDARLVQVMLEESSTILRVRRGTIIVQHRLGFVCANAGIDHSNVCAGERQSKDVVLLLPLDPDASAQKLREQFQRAAGVEIGVLIIDSHGRAWRLGTVGVMIGVAGIPALLDLRGRPDLFERPLMITQVGVGDELAAAASLLMGQADEGLPVVHVRGWPYALRESSLQEILRPEQEDMFR